MADKTILLVEDNPDHVELTLRALKKCNITHEVVVVGDGAEALDYLFGTGTYSGRDTSFMPAVVILDLKLPKVDGMEVLRRLRADDRTKAVPVAVLTSSERQMDKIESYGLGAKSYIRRPADFPHLVEAMRLGVHWLLSEEPPPMLREDRGARHPPDHRREHHHHRNRSDRRRDRGEGRHT